MPVSRSVRVRSLRTRRNAAQCSGVSCLFGSAGVAPKKTDRQKLPKKRRMPGIVSFILFAGPPSWQIWQMIDVGVVLSKFE